MSCDITDFRCTYINELIGDKILAVLILGAIFFGYCAWKKVDLKTTIWLSCVYFPIVSYFIVGTSLIIALATLVASLTIAFLHSRIIGNR